MHYYVAPCRIFRGSSFKICKLYKSYNLLSFFTTLNFNIESRKQTRCQETKRKTNKEEKLASRTH